MAPRVEYATTVDGVRIAFATCGRGRTVVSMPPIPFRHVQLEWELAEDRRWLEWLSSRYRLVQYDPRGLGLSERSVSAWDRDGLARDIDAVLDALGAEQVALIAAVTSGPLAISYAARHPERVSHLVLWCVSPHALDGMAGPHFDALTSLIDRDWELFTETAAHVVRGWSAAESAGEMARLLRAAASPEALRAFIATARDAEVVALLPEVRCPTLVLQRREVTWVPLERAIDLTSRIPDARLVVFEGTSMAPWAGDMRAVTSAIDEFLGASTGEVAALERAPANAFRREGDYWTLAFAGRLCRLRDAKGLHHIAYLLARPGEQVAAVELLAALEPASARSHADAGPRLDAAAKSAYRRRLEELEDQLAEAERFDDIGRAEAARREIELLRRELSAAVGLGGRDRPTGSSAERARLTVTKRIRDALERIRQQHTDLGEHLARAIRTGLVCSYAPGPEQPSWSI